MWSETGFLRFAAPKYVRNITYLLIRTRNPDFGVKNGQNQVFSFLCWYEIRHNGGSNQEERRNKENESLFWSILEIKPGTAAYRAPLWNIQSGELIRPADDFWKTKMAAERLRVAALRA